MAQRSTIYAVQDTSLLESHPPRVVMAPSAAAAIKFVAKKYKATPVNAKELAELYKKGVQVEDVDDEAA